LDQFYAILRKSVASEGRHSAASRVEIYDRARVQLERLIAESDPPMSADTEAAYRNQLEQAIVQIESEQSGYGADHNPTADAVADALEERHRAHPETARPHISPPGPTPGLSETDFTTPDGGAAGAPGVRLSKIVLPLAVIVGGFGLVLVGAWMLVSSIFAPSVPSMDVVARRLERTGAASLFAGAAAARFSAPEDATVENVEELFGQGAVRITSQVKKAKARYKTEGAFIPLNPMIRTLLYDSTLRATVVARAAPDNPSAKMGIAISTGAKETSGWQRFRPDTEWRAFSVEYAFGPEQIRSRPVVSVLADTEGEGRAIEVREINLQIIPN